MLYAFSSFGMCHITYGAIIRLSNYCKVHSQIQLVSCCEGFPSYLKERFLHYGLLPKKWISPSKRGFLIKKSGSPAKREVSTSHYRKKCLLFTNYETLWIIFALRCVHIVYIIIIFPHCISSATIFPFLLSFLPAFLVFQVLFSLLYLYIVVLHPFVTTQLW